MSLPQPIQDLVDILDRNFIEFEEYHLPLDLRLQRMLLPDTENRPSYMLYEERLVGLNLGKQGLKEVDLGFLEKPACAGLMALNLAENEFEKLGLPASLTQMRHMDLSENKRLRNIHFTSAFPELKRLNLEDCKLESFDLPAGFEALELLHLGKNASLASLKFEVDFPALKYLYVRNSGLKELEIHAELPELEYIFANQNHIESFLIRRGIELPALECIDLRNNQIKEVGVGFFRPFPNLLTISLNENPLPESIRGNLEDSGAKDLEFLKRYTEELAMGEAENNECKVLLLGNGGVGKSCFLGRLVHDQFNHNWESTHGIVIQENYIGDNRTDQLVKPYVYNIWDFAGQDIYHATHRLFMQANAIYLILWDKETQENEYSELEEMGEMRQYDNYSLEYWLHYAEKRGKGSPAILVQTKVQDDGIRDLPKIRDNYDPKFLVGFEHIDSAFDDLHENGYVALLAAMRKAIMRIKENEQIPKSWDEIREAVKSLKAKGQQWMKLEDFNQLASAYAEPMDILRWLTQSGTVFYDENHFKHIILDQFWAIEAIYALFDRKMRFHEIIEKRKGILDGDYLLKEVWAIFDQTECELFISFLLSCEMCFEITDPGTSFAQRRFVAPQLLPARTEALTEDFWEGRETLYMRFEHEHFHYGIIQSFIVRSHFLSSNTSLGESRDIWKMGIRMRDGTQWAQVEAKEKCIDIRATPNSVGLLRRIRQELENIRDEQGIALVSLDGEGFVELKQVETLLGQGETHIANRAGKIVELDLYQIFLGKEAGQSIGEKRLDLREQKGGKITTDFHSDADEFQEFIGEGKLKAAIDWLAGNATGKYRLKALGLKGNFRMFDDDCQEGELREGEIAVQRSQFMNKALKLYEKCILNEEDEEIEI